MTSTRPSARALRPWRRVAAGVAVAALLPVLVAGCSADRLGSAAIVEGETISTSEVQGLAQEYLDVVPGQDPGQVQQSLLSWMIFDRILQEMAADYDVRVTAGQAASQVDQLVEQVGGRRKLVQALASQQQGIVPPSFLEEWMHIQLTSTALQQKLATTDDPERGREEFLTYARKLDVEVNPRYGRWSADAGIEPLISGGLASTEAELTGDKS